jgi:formate dehydrogenase major subunit
MLIKRSERQAARQRLSAAYAGLSSGGLNRRGFLHQAGLGGAGLAALGALPALSARRAEAVATSHVDRSAPMQRVKNICTHCSVGCTVIAEVQNGIWVGQEPAWESPINRGTHCAKGASVREIVLGERRLRYPMKLVNGEWQRHVLGRRAGEITAKLTEIRVRSGPDSVFWIGSAKFTNEAATCSASSAPSGAPTTSTTRRASATRPRSRAWRTPGATARRRTATTTSAIPRP